MSLSKRFIIIFSFSLLCLQSLAQQTTIYTDKEADFRTGLELFNKQKYGIAQQYFNKVYTSKTLSSTVKADAQYYAAICGLELFNADAEDLLLAFVRDNPTNPKVKYVNFHLGNYYYRKKSFKNAIAWFNKVEIRDLSESQKLEYKFKLGYSYFERNEFQEAKGLLFEIKDIDSKYASAAKYYYAHIAYQEKNYETALQEFLKLTQNETFSSIAPYYITQIYYMQGKYEEVIKYAPGLLDSANAKRSPEIARMLGDSYYKTSKYQEAIPYLEKYHTQAGFSNENVYQLAYSNYRSGNFDQAIKYFSEITAKNDTLAQNAYYHLGDSYLKTGQKKYARNAFLSASKYKVDPELREDALFNYAKLSYELADNPYNEAINAFEKYIREYPDSKRSDQAYEYLVNVYLTTKNFKNAYESIEKIKIKNEALKTAHQKIAYNRAIELYNNHAYKEAVTFFDKSMLYKHDKKLNASALFWKAEALYKQNMYELAIASYKAFLFEPGAVLLDVYNTANYGIGYSYYKMKDYPNAITWFRNYTGSYNPKDVKKANDAFIRIGDSYFINRDFSNAIDYYTEAIKLKAVDVDYAQFQRAVALGVTGKNDEQINILTMLLNTYPKSAYADDAKYELGNSYMVKGDYSKAKSYFKQVINEYPNSSYVTRSLLKTALINYNSDQYEEALQLYKQILTQYPSTPETRDALAGLKNVYVELGKVDEYKNFIAGLTNVNISNAELDSTTYEAAEFRFMKGDCEASIKDFTDYLLKYPNGFFKLNASFYRAECLYKKGDQAKALEDYAFIISQPKNIFTEKSLIKAADINYKSKNYSEALTSYIKLQEVSEVPYNIVMAIAGQLKCNYLLKDYKSSIRSAGTLLSMEKVPADIQQEAHLIIAKSSLETGNDSLALTEFQITDNMAKNIMSAESKYNIAKIFHKRGMYKQCEDKVFELVNQVPSYDYWIAMGFILLADNYLSLNDSFQAKATLQSVIDNSENEQVVNKAKEKLNGVLDQERKEEEARKKTMMEIRFDTNSIYDQQLFEESIKTDE